MKPVIYDKNLPVDVIDTLRERLRHTYYYEALKCIRVCIGFTLDGR